MAGKVYGELLSKRQSQKSIEEGQNKKILRVPSSKFKNQVSYATTTFMVTRLEEIYGWPEEKPQ